jgi:hypothetical protein
LKGFVGVTDNDWFAFLSQQAEIECRVEAVFKLAIKIEKRVEVELSRVEKMTQSILARAFRGELVLPKAAFGCLEVRVGG